MVLVMTKYQEALTLLNQIEFKYGSIVNCPEDDPDYLRIREIYPSTGHGKNVDNFENQIYRLAHEGFAPVEVVRLISANDSSVYDYIRKHRIKFKTVFKYPPSQSNKFKWLKARGYSISKGDYRWKFIRNGSYYLPPYLDKPVIKQGINSYIYEEDC